MDTRTVTLGVVGLGTVALGVSLARALRGMDAAPGRRKSPGKLALELGARLLQTRSPLNSFSTYVVGFHPMKDDPHHQMVAHHFCRVINDDFMQCVIFDGNGPDARLTGVEYIVSERLYATLPEEERQFWHPHNYEILSGTLIAPGLPERVERELMRRLMNSYGKTWHFWMTGEHGHDLPYGTPCLAWSFNRDEEADERMIARRDAEFGVSSVRRRHLRAGLAARAHPQDGVGVTAERLGRWGSAPDGVRGTDPRG